METVKYSEESNCMNLQMLRASHRILKAYEDAYRPFGVKATQMPVLSLIAQNGEMTTKEIADRTESERSVLSRKLAVMEKNGWITALTQAQTREKVFTLTQLGRDLLSETRPVREKIQAEIFSQLNDEEQFLLLNLCDKIHTLDK